MLIRILTRVAKFVRAAYWVFSSAVGRAYLAIHGVKAGPGLSMYSLPFCRRHPSAKIIIGSQVKIRNKMSENPAGVSHPTTLVAGSPGARLTIGDHVGISGAVIYCSERITIESHVNIGAGARIYDTDFHPLEAEARRRHQQDRIQTAPVVIQQDAWIGASATVLKGVTIGARSVIAAGAVVTSDIPPDVVAGGVPARVIRKLKDSEAPARFWPRITVVTPSWNQAAFLRQAMESVLQQGYPNLEYIVMDGGSTDGSVEIIKSFESQLAYWQSRKDDGQADAIRMGFTRASGEILCWLNSDDVLLPGALHRVAQYFMENPEVEAANGGGYVIDEQGNRMSGLWAYSEGVATTYRRLIWYDQDGMYQQATFWRRSAYEAVGGLDPSWFFIMDFDLFVRLAARRQFGRIPALLACFRSYPGTKSQKYDDVRLTELAKLRQAHGCTNRVLSRVYKTYYRSQSLLRKARTSLPVQLGWKAVPRPLYVSEKLP